MHISHAATRSVGERLVRAASHLASRQLVRVPEDLLVRQRNRYPIRILHLGHIPVSIQQRQIDHPHIESVVVHFLQTPQREGVVVTGGEQDVSSISDPERNEASVLQMAMIGLMIDPECLRNPVSGFTVLREISVETGRDNRLDDLVLGTIFYTFEKPCTGRIKVPLATGSFILSLGKEVEFNMMDK